MAEISVSILTVEEEIAMKTFYELEVARNRFLSYRCYGW